MVTALSLCLALLVAGTGGAEPYRAQYPLPDLRVPDGWGVNIHFTQPAEGEMQALKAAGFKWVRMDFFWHQIETKKGEYDFSAYDTLLTNLERAKIRPILILDYGNALYQDGAPRSPEARAAFCRFVAAALQHFRGRGVVWEMYNEPNIGFWLPKPNVEEYIALAQAVGKTVRETAPDEWFVGPATSGFDWGFLDACFKAGLLEYWDAVTVHPYRTTEPETALPEWFRLREMIDHYKPENKSIPMFAGEWGYSEKYAGLDLDRQGLFITRQYLSNLLAGVPLTIWYDWKDDGKDPKEPEHHFGTVYTDLQPKPAYKAVEEMKTWLAGFAFSKRLALSSPNSYRLLFARGKEARIVEWTSERGGTTWMREKARLVGAKASQALIDWATLPGYARVDGGKDVWKLVEPLTRGVDPGLPLELGWGVEDDEVQMPRWNGTVNEAQQALPKLFERLAMLSDRSETPRRLRVTLTPKGEKPVSQVVVLQPAVPLRLTAVSPTPTCVGFVLESPLAPQIDQPLAGQVRLSLDGQSSPLAMVDVALKAGQSQATAFAQLPSALPSDARFRTRFGPKGAKPWLSVPPVRLVRLDATVADGWAFVAEGDEKVEADLNLTAATPPDGLPFDCPKALRLEYRFGKGWRYVPLHAKNAAPLPDKPSAVAFWFYGDRSGNILRMRFQDSTGQTFQPTYGPIDWTGWRLVTMPLTGDNAGRWGGAADGVVHYPIQVEALALIDSLGPLPKSSAVWVAGPCVVVPD